MLLKSFDGGGGWRQDSATPPLRLHAPRLSAVLGYSPHSLQTGEKGQCLGVWRPCGSSVHVETHVHVCRVGSFIGPSPVQAWALKPACSGETRCHRPSRLNQRPAGVPPQCPPTIHPPPHQFPRRFVPEPPPGSLSRSSSSPRPVSPPWPVRPPAGCGRKSS